MESKLNILIVDDEERVVDEIKEFLKSKKYQVFSASTPTEAFKLLHEKTIHIVILDVRLPEMSGLDVLEKIKEKNQYIEVIMISGHGDMNTVIDAMRRGATDYFAKPFRLVDMQNAIMRTRRFIELNRKLKIMESGLDRLSKLLLENIGSQLLGKSKAMKHLTTMMAKVAQTDNTSVLILGESGTGKELVAHGIHYMSQRSKNTFYSVNCSAIPESLFESEFFGHKKGAFTGATEDKKGWFEIADGGTLFLDEISDMPLGQQAKLLRVLEERKVSKVGSRETVTVDVRVIAASNKNLEELTEQNKFRLDLYHRLSIFVIDVPSLHERTEDISVLSDYFLKMYATRHNDKVKRISNEAMNMLNNHVYKGNVRELRNMIQRAVILCEGEVLLPEHFNIGLKNETGNVNNTSVSKTDATANNIMDAEPEDFDLESNEKRLIIKAMEKANGNKAKAAQLLHITWQALDRRMKKFGIEFNEIN